MARARFSKAVIRRVSGVPADGTVEVFDNTTATRVTDTLFAADTGPDALPNPFSFTAGLVEFYLDSPRRVRLVITPNGAAAQTFDNVDVPAAAGGTMTLDTDQEVVGRKTFSAVTFVRALHALQNQALSLLDNAGNTRALIGTRGLTVGITQPPDGAGVLALNDAGVVPAANPTNGVVIYSEGGVARLRQPDGKVLALGGGGGTADGVVLTAPDGGKWALGVTNTGALSTTKL